MVQRYIFEEECESAGAPPVVAFGVRMCAPVLLRFGTNEQKQRFLPRIYNGDDFWVQGYSEPGAGSDLASLKTRAVRDGDHYVVTGQKIWTTLGHYGDWIFCLVRTDASREKRQEGISFLLIDMKSPGITVRPIQTIDGGVEVNETFFDDVKVPVENVLGGSGGDTVTEGDVTVISPTGNSEGCFNLGGETEKRDAVAVIEHFAEQPWSNGNVAAGGKSYDGTTANGVATLAPTASIRCPRITIVPRSMTRPGAGTIRALVIA